MPRIRTTSATAVGKIVPGDERRGAVAVLAAVCLLVTIAFLAFSADYGYMVVTQVELQNAADAAAISGARALRDGREVAIQTAKVWAGKNAAAGQNVVCMDEDIEIGHWDQDTTTFTVIAAGSQQASNAVRVTCRRVAARGNPLPLFFASILGTAHADVQASAIALTEPSTCGLFIGLNKVDMSGSSHTDSYNSDNGPYNSATAGMKGHVCSNTTIKMSGSAAIGGDAHPGPGEEVSSSSSIGVLGEIEPLTEPIVLPPVDPGDAAYVNDNGSIPTTDEGKNPLASNGDFKLSGGDGVDLPPGTYYFKSFSMSGSTILRLSGPTVIYTNEDFTLSGGTIANTSQKPRDLQIYIVNEGKSCQISGEADLYAAVYAPTSKIIRSGSADFYGMLAGAELTLSGDGGIHADESLDILEGSDGKTMLVQ